MRYDKKMSLKIANACQSPYESMFLPYQTHKQPRHPMGINILCFLFMRLIILFPLVPTTRSESDCNPISCGIPEKHLLVQSLHNADAADRSSLSPRAAVA